MGRHRKSNSANIMGGKTTKLFKNSSQPTKTPDDKKPSQFNNLDNQPPDNTVIKNNNSDTKSPFVHFRRGSMYIDDDGDIAHEFYVESKEGSKVTLKRISNQFLTPQGDVPLEVPCIRNDYPVVLLDQNRVKE